MKQSSNNKQAAARSNNTRAAFALLLVLTLPLLFLACSGNDSKRNVNSGTSATPTASPAPTSAALKLTIDGDRAFEHVRKQVEFGPRPAGSAELARTRDYLVGELKSYGLNVRVDEWQATTPVGQRKMANVTAEIPGESGDVILLASHYDTKLYKQFRFEGANDGASSTGALLEMARVLAASGQKPRLTYWLVFFDGEEAFCEEWEQCTNPDGPDNTYGSRHYVKQLKEQKELQRVRAMILLDMIGYKNLRLGRDEEMSTGWLIDEVWRSARDLGYGAQFVDDIEGVGGDDHEPFLKEGIESLDIIQLSSYPYWHKAEDTLDKISPRSLKIVADVVLASLPRIEEHILSRGSSS
jgi:glutaminyl-peptide cyclotransferase